MPGISVIVPAYNMARYLPQAIQSVVEGSFDDVEVIVVDDGSTDDTSAIVLQYTDRASPRYDPRVRYHYQANMGKSAAVNRGLRLASGKYVAFLDADDRLTPNSLRVRREAFSNGRAMTELVIGAFEVFDEEGQQGIRRVPQPSSPAELKKRFYASYKTPFHLNACLIPKSLAQRVGPFDEAMKRCQDIDYSIRLLNEAQRVESVGEVVYSYRKHRGSISDRTRYRLKTIRHRPAVLWKNLNGITRLWAVPCGVLFDVGKALYELTGNYKG